MITKRITIYDIAEKAGVSVGTVNRALNDKDRISEKTKQNILNIAKELGYSANPAAQGLRRTPITIGAILFCSIDKYVDDVIEGMEETAHALEKYNVYLDIRKIPFSNRIDCTKKATQLLDEFENLGYKGIALFLSHTYDELPIIAKKIDTLADKGIVLSSVANDLSHTKCKHHVGINAEMAGEMAAEVLALSCPGEEVAILISSQNSPIGMQYIRGFKKHHNIFSNIKIYEHFDDIEKIPTAVENMLSNTPTLKGVYMATASSNIACEYMREKSDITIITTDILPETPKLLEEKISNAVIFQNPYKQGKIVIRNIYECILGQAKEEIELIPPQILLNSNINAYMKKDEIQ